MPGDRGYINCQPNPLEPVQVHNDEEMKKVEAEKPNYC
tara:strand:+ start:331 stop:444 length:114 start_codon:yes stop_codon:yes gene_type:complete